MLQQTRVDTVVPYYARFLTLFPSVRVLADAAEGDVLAAWSGLGYYRRARMLHAGAKEIARRGSFPASREALLTVPGVGPYTASAVASIAHGEAAELVDGNVARVLARLFALTCDVKSPRGQTELWAIAKRELRREDPGAWNQALMELGATVCTPKKPACEVCPLESACKGYAEGGATRVAELPVTSPKKKPREEAKTALVLLSEDGVLLGERSPHLRFGGLWEPPMLEGHLAGPELERAFGPVLAGRAAPGELRAEDCGIVVHVLSHRRMSVRVYSATMSHPRGAPWPSPASGDYARFAVMAHGEATFTRGMSTLARKVLALASAIPANSTSSYSRTLFSGEGR